MYNLGPGSVRAGRVLRAVDCKSEAVCTTRSRVLCEQAGF